MERYLITHSLLSSWLWAMKGNPYEDMTTEKDGYAEFISTLNREPIPTNEAMQKGIDFENLVTDIINNRGDQSNYWYEAACQVANIVKGGLLQYKTYKEIQVHDMTLILYGRLDVLKAGTVYDIKFSASSYDIGKYIQSTQHPMYLELIDEAKQFTYLVSNGSNVWKETYRREDTRSIVPIISDFMDWLTAQGLMGTYKEKWITL